MPWPGKWGAYHQHGPHRWPAGGHPPGLPPDPGGGDGPGPENLTVHTLALKKGARLRQEDTPPAHRGTRWPPCWTTPGPPWRRGDTPLLPLPAEVHVRRPGKRGVDPPRLRQPVQHLHDGGAPHRPVPRGRGVTKFVENRGGPPDGQPQVSPGVPAHHRHHSRGKSRLGVTGPTLWLPHPLLPLCDFVP